MSDTIIPHLRADSRSLKRAIFNAASPEAVVRSLPAQSLYLAMRSEGIEASSDIFELTTTEQSRVLVDLDCWKGDRLDEEHLWKWLEMACTDDSHALLRRLVRALDLKIVGLLIAKYVIVRQFDEPTEQPPLERSFTPDKGYTWLHINLGNSLHHFYLGRLLAMLFESDPDVFYRILALPQVETLSTLEEESYNDKRRRLSDEGIPDEEVAADVTTPLPLATAAAELRMGRETGVVEIGPAVHPLLYDGAELQPLGQLLEVVPNRLALESALTFLCNAHVVRWQVDFSDAEAVTRLVHRVKGALNIGLELALSIGSTSLEDCARVLGVQKLCRLGFWRLQLLRDAALRIPLAAAEAAMTDQPLFAILAGAREPFPEAPAFLARDGSFIDHAGKLDPGQRPIETLQDVESIERLIKDRFAGKVN